MAAQRPDDLSEWVENVLGDADEKIAAIRVSHYEPNSTLKADIQALKFKIDALAEIVQMLGAEVEALRSHDAP
jgi:hypothetical protein